MEQAPARTQTGRVNANRGIEPTRRQTRSGRVRHELRREPHGEASSLRVIKESPGRNWRTLPTKPQLEWRGIPDLNHHGV
ncbi:hypothetical protein KCP74_23275 [Salmonella enterica subsp. enterica]|nr:hypothetical protein KCP74_23275 [Salmonella enterica subsp. enterica]